MKMTLAEIARVVKAQPLSEADGSHVVTGLAFDSRKLKPGMLFVPLRGERDGHEFIPAAATQWRHLLQQIIYLSPPS